MSSAREENGLRQPEIDDRSYVQNGLGEALPESWRLNAIGAPSSNQPQRDAGTFRHEEKAAAEETAGGSIAVGRVLIVGAVLALLALTMWTLSR